MNKKTLVEPQTVKLLYEIGLSAASRGFGEQTRPIFDAFQQCFPNHAGSSIGYAMIDLSRGDYESAISMLKTHGVNKPVCAQEAKGLLLVAYNMAGRTAEAQNLQKELMHGTIEQNDMSLTQPHPDMGPMPGSGLY